MSEATAAGGSGQLPPADRPYDAGPAIDAAVRDAALRRAVFDATMLKDVTRKECFASDFGARYAALRRLGGLIRQHTLDHLDAYLEQFVDRAEAAGAEVHFAADAGAANAICLDIARRHGCTRCVKTKSMVTEETHLLTALESAGIETVATDLGEFIIQLDHDRPSHIVTPMIHKDRAAVGRAFRRELGVEYTDDPEALTRIAREHLREKFRRADLGVTGANFLLAETGSVVLCTNEGNGRFCTTRPRVQVVLAGIEKVVPTWRDLAVMLKLLARSSTAQAMTIYTQLITGPRRGHEHDGPEQVHVILVDNGRSSILRPGTRELLRCIRCGACLNACPVYRQIGGHAYGATYCGPIGALISPLLVGLAHYRDLPQLSSLCGACYEACPVAIDIPRHLIALRAAGVDRWLAGWPERMVFGLWTLVYRYPRLYRLAGWVQRRATRLIAWVCGNLDRGGRLTARGWLRWAPGPVGGWTRCRDLPTPPAGSFRGWWRRRDRGDDA